MPPLPPVPRVIKVRLSGPLPAGTSWAVLDHWRYSGVAPTNADLSGFANDIHVAYSNHMAAQFNSAGGMDLVECQDLTSPTSAFGLNDTGVLHSGGAQECPNSACVLESKHGNLRYRGGHSRTYWPPLGAPGSIQDPNNWTGPAINAFDLALTAYLNEILATAGTRPFAPIQRSIVHYKGKSTLVTYPYVEDVTSAEVLPPIRSQRGRLT